jgi:hypothetical protein
MQSESPKCVEIDIRRLLGFVHKNRRVEVWHLHSPGALPRRVQERLERFVVPMINPSPRQLDLFTDGAWAAAAAKRPKPPRPTEADLRGKLDGARQGLRQIVVLGLKSWLPEQTRRSWRRSRATSGGRSGCITGCWRAFERSSVAYSDEKAGRRTASYRPGTCAKPKFNKFIRQLSRM